MIHKGRAVIADKIAVGLDLAKNVFQMHGTDGAGRAVLEFFRRLPRCVIARASVRRRSLLGL